ncbi:hypothetical protein Tco_0370327 [Tanacetum coccineum]
MPCQSVKVKKGWLLSHLIGMRNLYPLRMKQLPGLRHLRLSMWMSHLLERLMLDWVNGLKTMKKVQRLLSMTDGDKRKHVLDYTHVDLRYVEDQRKNLVSKFNSFNQEFSSCKSELSDLKNTKALNCSLQNEIARLYSENESLKDEISELKKVIEEWTSSKFTLDQLLTKQVPRNIIHSLGGRGKRKDAISPKEVLFTKADESPSETTPKITSDSELECDNQDPLPPLLKFLGVEPIGTSNDEIPLAYLNLTLSVPKKTKQVTEKVSSVNVAKKKTQTKSPYVLNPCPKKKANMSTE